MLSHVTRVFQCRARQGRIEHQGTDRSEEFPAAASTGRAGFIDEFECEPAHRGRIARFRHRGRCGQHHPHLAGTPLNAEILHAGILDGTAVMFRHQTLNLRVARNPGKTYFRGFDREIAARSHGGLQREAVRQPLGGV